MARARGVGEDAGRVRVSCDRSSAELVCGGCVCAMDGVRGSKPAREACGAAAAELGGESGAAGMGGCCGDVEMGAGAGGIEAC